MQEIIIKKNNQVMLIIYIFYSYIFQKLAVLFYFLETTFMEMNNFIF